MYRAHKENIRVFRMLNDLLENLRIMSDQRLRKKVFNCSVFIIIITFD